MVMNIIDKYLTCYRVVLMKDDSEIELFASYSKSEAIDKAKHLSSQRRWAKRFNLVSGNKYLIQVLDEDHTKHMTKPYIVK